MGNPVTKNYSDRNGDRTVIGGELKFETGAVISGDGAADLAAVATATTLGGIKAADKGLGDTVEAKIGADGKLYVPTYPALPVAATALTAGIVKAAENQAAIAADATAEAVRAAFIDLILKLKAAGIMVDD